MSSRNLVRDSSGYRHAWFAVLPVLLITAWMGVDWLNKDILWVDEIFSYEHSGGSHYGSLTLGGVIETSLYWTTWPPLYQVVFYYWGGMVGWTLFAGRALSLLCGLVTVAVVYRLSAEMASRRAGLFAAIYIGMSTFLVIYLHDMRGYTLHILLAAVFLWVYWYAVRPEAPVDQKLSWRLRFALVLASAALLYSQPIAILAFPTLGLYHLLFAPRGKRWWHTLEMLTFGGILYLPWGMISVGGWVFNPERAANTNAMSFTTFFETAFKVFGNGYPILLFLFVLSTVVLLKNWSRAASLVAFWFSGILLLSLLANEVVVYLFHIRHVIILLPLIALLFGFAVGKLAEQPPFTVPIILLMATWIVAGVYQSRNADFINELPHTERVIPRDEFMHTIERVKAEFGDDDVLVFLINRYNKSLASHKVMEHYLYDTDVRHSHAVYLDDLKAQEPATIAQMRAYIGSAPHVWTLIETVHENSRHLDVLNAVLTEEYTHCFTDTEPDTVRLALYARDACPNASAARTP